MATETTKSIELPIKQFRNLEEEAHMMGLTLPAYIAFLLQCRTNNLYAKAQDAARLMFSKRGESLRKLAK